MFNAIIMPIAQVLGYIFNQANGLGYGTAIGAYSKGQIALYHTYNDNNYFHFIY